MSRDKITNAAFAHIMNINDVEYKLLRHHNITTVKHELDHESVDIALLKLCCYLVDQVPVSDGERDKISLHLYEHAKAMNLQLEDIWSDETKRRIANLYNPSQADNPINNESLNVRDGSFPDDNLSSSPSLPKGTEPRT